MGQTMTEKIFSLHSEQEARPGDVILADLDYMTVTDTKGPLGSDLFREMHMVARFADRTLLSLDHYSPPANSIHANEHVKMRDLARDFQIELAETGDGVCHQLALENGRILPGSLVLVTDSHAATAGAVNALSLAISSSEMAAVLAEGKLWFRVPDSIKVVLKGELKEGVTGKDLALYFIDLMGIDGADYMSLEIMGEGLKSLKISDRLTFCNLMIETASKTAIMPADQRLVDWLTKYTTTKYTPVFPDKDAEYRREVSIDLNKLEPYLALPHGIRNTSPLKENLGTPVGMGFVGTCTNGRLDDLEITARILKGHRIKKNFTLMIAAASRKIYLEALKAGYIDIFLDAGAMVMPVGCGACIGASGKGVPADNERVISAANRNSRGRMGNDKVEIFLASPASVAAAAVTGVITDPREFLKRGVTDEI